MTSVWSASKSQSDLCAALVAGRAWFFDPLYWRGRLDLTLAGQAPMGGVIFTGKDRPALTVRVTGLPTGSRLEVVIGRCDRPGLSDLTPDTRTVVVPARQVQGGQWSTTVSRAAGVYARVEVRLGNGTIVGASNPVWAFPQRLRGTIDVPARAWSIEPNPSGRVHVSQRKNRPAMRVTTAANTSSTAIGASTADGPSPRTITSSIPSFRYVSGNTLETVLSHSGAWSSGKNDPDRNAIGSTTMLAIATAPRPCGPPHRRADPATGMPACRPRAAGSTSTSSR